MIFRYSGKQVYFIRRGDSGLIKIGCSVYPEARRKQLQIDHKTAMEMLAAAPAHNGFADERRIHADFAKQRVEGEWFNPSARLMRLVERVSKTGRLPQPRPNKVGRVETRNQEISRRRMEGETLRAIGSDFGITRERVRQICLARMS